MTDKFGQEMKEGDYIIYGRTCGRSADLGIGRILKVEEEEIPEERGRWMHVPTHECGHTRVEVDVWMNENAPGLEVIPTPPPTYAYYQHVSYRYFDPKAIRRTAGKTSKLRVNSIQGLEFKDVEGTSQHGRPMHRPLLEAVEVRKVTLNFPNRCMVVNETVPDIVKELLDEKTS